MFGELYKNIVMQLYNYITVQLFLQEESPLHTKIIQVSAAFLIVFTLANTHIFNGLQSMVWCVPEGTDYFSLM